jgi:hypothetical protein
VIKNYAIPYSQPLYKIVDPKDDSFTVLNSMTADSQSCKAALILLDMLVKELAIIDKSVPEAYSTLLRKANEFMMQIKPALQEGYHGASGKFRLSDLSETVKKSMLLGGLGFNKEFVDKMLAGMNADRDDNILYQYGITIKNSDLSTLKPGFLPSLNIQNWVINFYRNKAETTRAMPFSKGILVLDPLELHEAISGSSATLSTIKVDKWKNKTQIYSGRGKTIFNEFSKIFAPLRIAPDHTILIELRNGTLANSLGARKGMVRAGYPEIVVYDPNQKEYRHLHNSLYMIMKRFIYEELLERSGNPQAECYQDSLMYAFRRGNCAQIIIDYHSNNYQVFNSIVIFLKNLQMAVKGIDIDASTLSNKDLDDLRLELFNEIMAQTSHTTTLIKPN